MAIITRTICSLLVCLRLTVIETVTGEQSGGVGGEEGGRAFKENTEDC